MNLLPEQFFTNGRKETIPQKILQFPITRIILAILFIAPAIFFMGFFTETLQGIVKRDSLNSLIIVAGQLTTFIALICLSVLYIRFIEKRKALEYSLKKSVPEWINGVAIGFMLMGSVALVNYLLGYYTVAGVSWHSGMLKWTFIFWTAALVEEIIIRAVIFRITEEYLGSWYAIIIQALLFGFLHSGNPDASIYSSIAITIEAGLLLAAAYMLTRRIWFVFGLHFSWNWFQGVFFGIDVSGNEVDGILNSTIEGPVLITGGEFGFETSIISLFLCTMVGILILRKAIKKGQLVRPFWKRVKIME